MTPCRRFARITSLPFLLVFFFSIVCSEVSAQFTRVYLDPDESNGVINTSFYSANEGYVAFRKWIGFTTDGGKTFQQKTIRYENVNFGLQPVSFPWTTRGVKAFDKNNILVYGEWGGVPSILSSDNGGTSFTMVFWSRIDLFALNNGITGLVFPENGNIGYAVDEDRIFKTVNKGKNWSLIYSSPGSKFHSIRAGSDNNVYVYSGNKMIKTINGGANWTQVSIPGGSIRAADFISPAKGWINVYTDPMSNIFYTSDGGVTWERKNIDDNPFTVIKFTDDRTGYSITGGNIFKTTDSGRIWEKLQHEIPTPPRIGGFSTVNNWGQNQLWAGTSGGLLESTSNAGGITIPSAIYVVDTAGVSTTNIVNLVNYSKQGYQYKWFRNGQLISTNYHAQYNPTPLKFLDTIQLVASNGTYTGDTTTRYVKFSPVIIESFSPTEAPAGSTITIRGQNFWSVDFVSFGGTRASSFTYISPTEIRAIVGSGSTGPVYVRTQEGDAYKAGFVYNAPPSTTLDFTVSDTILCKSERVEIRLQNTELKVEYRLLDAGQNIYGSVMGNGGEAILQTSPISSTGIYSVQMWKQGITKPFVLVKTASIKVEKTLSIMGADKINIATGEQVNYFQQSKEAASFIWSLHDGASIGSYNGEDPSGISYATTGDKSVTLISISANGCRDTGLLKAVTVYDKALVTDRCFVQNVDDIDTYDQYYETTLLHRTQQMPDNGYIISGFGFAPILPSRAGTTKQLPAERTAYVGRYSPTGVLLWQCHLGKNGNISGTAVDEQGNIYVTGRLLIHDYFYFNNGDSMRIGHNGEQLVSFYERQNAFILKLDPNGKYLWHTILFNTLVEGHGYSVSDIDPVVIKIRAGKMIVAGNYNSNLNYSRNGVRQELRSGWHDDTHRIFFLQLNTDGTFNWGMYWDGSSDHYLSGIELDAAGNLFVIGNHESNAIIRDAGDSYTYTIPRAGYYSSNAYLIKFNGSGKFQWRTTMTTGVSMNALSVDANGNAYVSGKSPYYYDPKGFEITEADDTRKWVNPGTTCILKFDMNGHYVWGRGTQGNLYLAYGFANFIKDNYVYFSYVVERYGERRASYKLSSTDGSSVMHSTSKSEFVLVKYSLDGNLQRVYTSGENPGGYVIPNNIYVDSDDNVVISGLVDKNNGGTGAYKAFGEVIHGNGTDGFIIRLKNDLCFTGTAPVADAGPDVLSCAKDSIMIGTAATGDRFLWSSSLGDFSDFSARPTVNPSIATTYYLYVTNNSGLTAIDSVRVSVKAAPQIEAGPSISVCINNPVKIGPAAVDGLSYSWESLPAGFTSTVASPTVQPVRTTSYILTATNAEACSTKDTVKLTVATSLLVSITMSGPDAVCRGTEAMYTAKATNTGDDPVFQWKVNGIVVGDASAIFKTKDLKQGDKLQVAVTTKLSCAFPKTISSSTKNISITDGVVPQAAIIPPDTSVCAGESLVFDSDVINPVTNISYDWRRNGLKAGDKHFYVLENPVDGDKVFLIVTASNGCSGTSADTTRTVTVIVGSLKPSISISGNSNVSKGQSSVITASVATAGNSPTFQWEDSTSTHGWAAIPGATGASLIYTPDITGDRLRCVVTSSDACSGIVKQPSLPLVFTVTGVTAIDPDPVSVYGVNVFPNPVSGVLYLRDLKLADQWQTLTITGIDGRRNIIQKDVRGMNRLDLTVTTLPSGMYILMLTDKSGKLALYKFIRN